MQIYTISYLIEFIDIQKYLYFWENQEQDTYTYLNFNFKVFWVLISDIIILKKVGRL